jgi:hypothetical protein
MLDVLERPKTFSNAARRIVCTRAGGEPSFGTQSKDWDELLTETLARWTDDPSLIHDDDYPSPSAAIMSIAQNAACAFRARGVTAPTRIIPTADGGIAFEWDSYPTFASVTIHPDASVDLKTFEFGSLIQRRRSQSSILAGADDDAAW